MPDNPVLVEAVVALQRADGLPQIQRIVRAAARRLARAQGATLVLREGEHCFYADEDAISPLWKGQRFPIDQCISGWAMLHRQVAVIPDIRVDDRIPQAAYRPTFVRSLVMVPIEGRTAIGAIGVYWSQPRLAPEEVVAQLVALSQAAAEALRPPLTADKGQWGRQLSVR